MNRNERQMTRELTPSHPWTDRLSDYLDDELPGAQRRALRDHLAGCADCSAALEELRQVAARARALDTASEPATDLWPGIAARLTPRPAPWRHRVSLRPAWLVPRLAAAVVLLVTFVVAWGLFGRPRAPVRRASRTPDTAPRAWVSVPSAVVHDREFEQTVARLHREATARLTHDPHVVEVLDENLATLDAAIANYREALAETPRDHGLQDRIEQACEKKLDILRQAVSLAAEGTE